MADRKRNPNRPNPDGIENPTPHVAPGKTVVDTVLNAALAAGNGVVTLMAGLLAGVLVLYSGYVLYDTFSTQYKAYSSAWDLLQYKPEYITDNQSPLGANALEDINSDYRAWLTVYDTSIDYPVFQGEDDLYYAWHNFYKESSLTGAIYLAAMNSPDFSDSYNLIYGHHMDNGAMFGRLDSYRDEAFYQAHRNGIVVTKSGAFDVRLFAVAVTDAYENQIYSVGDRRDEVLEFLQSDREDAAGIGTELLYFDEAEAEGAAQILALSTCASAETSGRLVVFGSMTRRDLVTLDADGFDGVYDGQPHGPEATPSVDGAAVTYSVDGGETWTDEVPTITDVGELKVLIRVDGGPDGTVEQTVTVRVTPRPVTVRARDAARVYGEADPAWEADVEGLIGEDTIDYAISREAGDNVGSYAITPEGEAVQGNYAVTYIPGTLDIAKSGTLTLTLEGYKGEADGKPHPVTAKVNVEENTIIEYSTDGGKTWIREAPFVQNADDEKNVLGRAINPNYYDANDTAQLQLTAAESGTHETPEKSEEPAKPEEPETGEESEKGEEPAKPEEPETGEEPAKAEESEKAEEPEKGEEPAKAEEPEKGEESEKAEEPAKAEESEKAEEPAKAEDSEKAETSDKAETSEKSETVTQIIREEKNTVTNYVNTVRNTVEQTGTTSNGTRTTRTTSNETRTAATREGTALEGIGDYGTPLGVNNVYAMRGDCFE